MLGILHVTGAIISRDAALRLASYIEGRRRDIVASVVRSALLPRPGSSAAQAFTNTLLDRLCQELDAADGDALEIWADAEAQGEDAFEHSRIVVVACTLISVSFLADCGHDDEVFAYLTRRSSELEERFRAGRSAPSEPSEAERLVSRDEVVASLLSAIEARDTSTCEHSRAVGMWSGRIAKTLGLSAAIQNDAALAGTLHDVGKISTPTEILLKAGPLDAQEWEAMRAHARVGAKMLERIPSLRNLAPAVRAHHERFDGSGYPDRLAATDIPILARIVSVADSFHAMISKRPYRQALPVAHALDELRSGVGSQWDPAVVGAMLEIVQPQGVTRVLRAVRGA